MERDAPLFRQCRFYLGAILISGIVLGFPAVGVGQSTSDVSDEAEAHYRRGTQLYEEGDYESAAEELRKAYSLAPAPMLLYNVSIAEWRAGALHSALTAAYRARAEGMPERMKPTIDARIRAFERLIAARDAATGLARRVQAEPTQSAEATERRSQTENRRPNLGTSGWIGVSLAAVGLTSLTGAYSVDRRLASDAEEFERAANRGDAAAYGHHLRNLRRKQRFGQILLGIGAVATATSAGFLIAEFSPNSRESERSRSENRLEFNLRIAPGQLFEIRF